MLVLGNTMKRSFLYNLLFLNIRSKYHDSNITFFFSYDLTTCVCLLNIKNKLFKDYEVNNFSVNVITYV